MATATECSVPTIANAGASLDTIAIDDTVTYTCNCGFAIIDADGGIMASMTVKCLTTGMLESLPVCGMFVCQEHIEYFRTQDIFGVDSWNPVFSRGWIPQLFQYVYCKSSAICRLIKIFFIVGSPCLVYICICISTIGLNDSTFHQSNGQSNPEPHIPNICTRAHS